MARPYKPTDYDKGRIFAWAAGGRTDKEIAERVGIAESTLQKYYAAELKSGRRDVEAEAINVVIQDIRSCDPRIRQTAAFFYLKTRCQWKETQRSEVEGKIEGGNLPVTVIIEGTKKT